MNSPANNAAASLGATDVGGPGGLLARLKQEAALKRAVLEQDASQLEQRTRGVDRTLRRAYAYLNDLCLQLNVLKPVWPKTFHVAETLSFGELAWGEGHANFRRQAGPTEDRPYEKVRLFLRLDGPAETVLERENPGMDKLRERLMDGNINFRLDEFRNDRGYVERGRFTIKTEIRAGLQFVGNYADGTILLKVNNLPRLGFFDFLIDADQLTEAVMEEIALLVMGESSRFFTHFDRVA